MPVSERSILNAHGSPCTPTAGAPASSGSASLTRPSLSAGNPHMHMHNVSYSAASAAAGDQGRTSPAGRERPHSAAASGGTRGSEPAALQPALQPGFSLQSLQPALAHEIEEIDGRDLQPSALQRSALQPSAALQLSALQSSALQPVLQPGALQPPSLQPERGFTRRSKAAARPATASASLRRSSSAVTVPRGSASAAYPRGSSAAGRAFKGGPSSGTPPPRRATHDTGGPHTHSYIHTRRTLTRAESAPPAAAAGATPSPGSAAELRGGSAAIRGGSAAISSGSAAGGASRGRAAAPSRAARGFVISDDLELIRRREGLEPTKMVEALPYG